MYDSFIISLIPSSMLSVNSSMLAFSTLLYLSSAAIISAFSSAISASCLSSAIFASSTVCVSSASAGFVACGFASSKSAKNPLL